MSTVLKSNLVDREGASRYLKVSVRTLDRYIRAGKLSSQSVDGRIWLKKDILDAFKKAERKARIVSRVDSVDSGLSTDLAIDKVDSSRRFGQDFVDIVSTPDKAKNPDKTSVYKDLYIRTKEELNEKQERLEIANYRVGQLENQLKNTMPVLKYHHENFEQQKLQEDLKKQIQEMELYAKNLSYKIKYEKLSKRVVTIILLILFALQPLWIIFVNSR